LFNVSPTRKADRNLMRMNRHTRHPPDVYRQLRERGVPMPPDIEVKTLAEPHSPFTWPLPDTVLDIDKAIDTARSAITADCAGDGSTTRGCRLVQHAELHMHWNERGDTANPV